MKKIPLTVMIATLGILVAEQTHAGAGAPPPDGTMYDLSFTGDGTTAFGEIYVAGDLATSGFLDITAGPDMGNYTLYTDPTGVTTTLYAANGATVTIDDLVNTAGINPIVDGFGLGFTLDGSFTGGYPTEAAVLSFDGYNLTGYGVNGNLDANGTATLTLATNENGSVPDTGSTAGLLTASLATMGAISRKRCKSPQTQTSPMLASAS